MAGGALFPHQMRASTHSNDNLCAQETAHADATANDPHNSFNSTNATTLTLSRNDPSPQLIVVSSRWSVALVSNDPPTVGSVRGVLVPTPLIVGPLVDVD